MSAQLNGEPFWHTMIVLDRRSLKLSASVAASGGKPELADKLANACPGKGIVLCRSTAIQQMNVKHAFVWSARYHASMQKLTSCHLLSLQLSVCHMTWIGICEYCFDKLQSVQPKTSSPSSSSGTASSCKAMASISAVKVSSGRKPRAL